MDAVGSGRPRRPDQALPAAGAGRCRTKALSVIFARKWPLPSLDTICMRWQASGVKASSLKSPVVLKPRNIALETPGGPSAGVVERPAAYGNGLSRRRPRVR